MAITSPTGRSDPNLDVGSCTCEADLPRRHLVAVGLVVAVAKLAFSATRVAPQLSPDELATLGMARWLSGGEWNMFWADTWRPGLSTILVPFFWAFDDPVWLLRAGLVINALLGGLAAVLLALILRRLTTAGPTFLLLTSAAIALMPSSFNASNFLWGEPLVTVCYLGSMWYVFRYFDSMRPTFGFAAVAVAVLGFVAHSRMLPFAVLIIGLVAGRALSRRRWTVAAGVLAAGFGGSALASWYSNWIVSNVWESPGSTNTIGGFLRRLSKPLEVLDAAVGQVWYQLAASAMLFGFGIVALSIDAFGRTETTQRRRDARILITSTAVMMGVSFVFMSGRSRADYTIYGRYTDAIVWPVLGAGIVWLVESRRSTSRRAFVWIVAGVAILSLELALVVNQLHSEQLQEFRQAQMVSGLVPVIGTQSSVRPMLVTLISLGAGAMLIAAVRLGSSSRRVAFGAVGGVMLALAVGISYQYRVSRNTYAPSRSIAAVACSVLEPGETIGVGFVRSPAQTGTIPTTVQLNYALAYQWYLPGHPFVTDLGLKDDVGPHVISPTYDPLLTEAGGQVLWEDVQVPLSLWLEPGDSDHEVAASATCQ